MCVCVWGGGEPEGHVGGGPGGHVGKVRSGYGIYRHRKGNSLV